MSAMDKVKRSREAEELGPPVEALSERVRALSEEARAFMVQLGEERERRATDWREAQGEAAAAWETAVAERIEPIAQAMVTLSIETRAAIEQQRASSEAQAREWSEAQERSAAALRESARAVHAAAEEMGRTVRGWNWTVWSGVVLAAMGPMAVLLIGSWLWLPRGWTLQESADGALYLQVREAPAVRATEPPTR